MPCTLTLLKNQSTAAAFFYGESSHVIKEPSSSDSINVAGIDTDGVYMPVTVDQDNIVTANVVLELCLNTYFSTSGATNVGANILINSVTLIFKDSDNYSLSSKTFCTAEILKRQSLLLPGDLELEAIGFFGSNDLVNNSVSHVLDLPNPLSIKIGNFIGNIATLRVTLYNNEANDKIGPRFIGAYVSYSVNQITPS